MYVYDPMQDEFIPFPVQRSSPMPFVAHADLRLYDFLGATRTETLWTDLRLLSAFDRLAAAFPLPLTVRSAFRRVQPGRRLCLSPRCTGLSLDVGYDLSPAHRERLRRLAVGSGMFTAVLPEYAAPTWVGLQVHPYVPVGKDCPFPRLRPGDKGACVFALQDALTAHGFPPDSGLTGCFDNAVACSLRAFCRSAGVPYKGEVGREIWMAL